MVLEAGSSRSGGFQGWFPVRLLLGACTWPPSCCVLTWPFLCALAETERERDRWCLFLSIERHHHIGITSTTSLKFFSPNRVTLGVRALTHEFRRDGKHNFFYYKNLFICIQFLSFFFDLWLCWFFVHREAFASYSRWASLVVALRLGCPAAYGILVPQQGSKPWRDLTGRWILTTGPPGKSLNISHFCFSSTFLAT